MVHSEVKTLLIFTLFMREKHEVLTQVTSVCTGCSTLLHAVYYVVAVTYEKVRNNF